MPAACTHACRQHSLCVGLALLYFTQVASGATGLPAPPRSLADQGPIRYYLELVVNGRNSGQVVEVNARGSQYQLDAELLRDLGVRLPGNPAGQIMLDQLPGVQVEYDSASQQLRLQVPADWLPRQQVEDPGLLRQIPADSSLGALFNYDLYYSAPANAASPYLSALLEQRMFDGFGVVSNTGIYTRYFGRAGNLDNRYLRYDTYWRHNDEQAMHSYQLGDYVNGALNWTSAVRMGGVRFSRNFAVRPDLVTYPLLRYDGQAAVPSTVDLFINGYKASSNELEPGPFTISNVPYISGAGEATVVTRDAQGRQVSTSLPFYVSNTLLARGLSDFDLSLGRLREDYGRRSFAYGDNAASGIYRYGVNDSLTLSGHAEAAGDLRLLGMGSDIALATSGTLSMATSSSRHQADSGQQYLVGYSYYSQRMGLNLQHLQRSDGYRDISTLGDYRLSRRADQVSASLSLDGLGNIGAGYFDIQARDRSRTRLLNLSYSRSLGQRSSFYLALNKDLASSGYSLLMQLVMPFEVEGLLNLGISRDNQRRYSERVVWSRAAPSEGGIGWNLGHGAGSNRYQQADLTWRTQNVQLRAGLYGPAGDYTRWADASGSLIWMDRAMFASNRINDAFVLVSTGGHGQVPIRYENQLVGRSDENGHLLVPWVAAYYPAKFQVESLDLPANVQVPDVEQRVAVRQGSGVLLEFPIRTVVAASISLVDEQGLPLPLGSQAEETTSRQRATVGWDGQVYFEGLGAANHLRVRLVDGGLCQAAFQLDIDKPTVSQVGPLPCRAVNGGTQ
ncbi:MAG: fimbria/pilus outer membrane usher protein [Pseudomonas piscis]|uniref:fimbria/pilus outer membrane usher protein n=1 Tax=Pseudomonas piscis TaxID=2614538 RepID=UPI003D2C6C0F